LDELPTFGTWEAIEKLGEGGACEVFRVRHRDHPEREVAIKVLADPDPEAATRFVAEARLLMRIDHPLLMRIDHPNVIRVHELDAEVTPPWLAMDLLSGKDLDEEREEGPFEAERAARIIADVAGGLAAVHALGVRHRDIKPANIMVGTDGVPRLIDFGIARRVQESHLTRAGFVMGTAAYMPPEVYGGDDPQAAQDTEAADVYGLGQTLCELLIGFPMYEREGDTTLLLRIMRDKMDAERLDPRQWRPTIPEPLARIVMDATRQEPEDRIQTAAALQRQLNDWLASRQAAAPAPLSALAPDALPPPPEAPMEPPPVPDLAKPTPPEPTEPPDPGAGAPQGPQRTEWVHTGPADAGAPEREEGPRAETPHEEAARLAPPEPDPMRQEYIDRGRQVVAYTAGGSLLALVGLFIVTATGLVLLWVFRPVAPPPLSGEAVHAAVVRQAPLLEPCATERADLTVTWVVHDGAAHHTRIDAATTRNEATRTCVVGAVAAMGFPEGTGAVTVPIHLR